MNRLVVTLFALGLAPVISHADDADRLVSALLGETPIIEDLHELTDSIGGRLTGTEENRQAVNWALETLRQAEVKAYTEDFQMPFRWTETSVAATVAGDANFSAGVLAKPFSTAANELTAPLVSVGTGSEAEFAQVAADLPGAWVIVETAVLSDEVGLAGLFSEYGDAVQIESRAFAHDVAGVVFMSSRPKNLVYRHNASLGLKNKTPLLVMERESAQRVLRLLDNGQQLTLTATIGVEGGQAYPSKNVVFEIPGSSRADEIVLFGAHLDSHALGTGALDNGVNVVMLMDIARQMTRLGLQPKRTIRFALWNGEEQGLVGSWKYTERHAKALDQHIVAASFDIGSGRTIGFFTGGRPELPGMLDRYLLPVSGLGPFQHVDAPVVGTDNFDFMIQGIPNLVALQADANYASNYHAESDTFDKVDQYQVRLNAAIAAAVIWGFANDEQRLPRHTRSDIEALIDATDLETQMRNFAVWDGWIERQRGRQD